MKLATRSSGIGESVTLSIAAKAKRMKSEGVDVLSLAAGEPDFDTPEHIKKAAVAAISSGFTKYTPSSGMPELRDAIAQKFKHDNGLLYDPKQIVVSNGAKHSLNNIFQVLCETGDEVIVPSPFWLSYPPMITMAEARPVFINGTKESGYKVTPQQIESAITKKTKAIIITSPSNPTGAVYSKKELVHIADTALKHDIFVVSDEIYEKLVYGDVAHISIASLGKDIAARTVVVNGVSKSYSMTGWRIGYAAGPMEIMTAIANLQSHAASNPCSISQKAALAALTGDQACVVAMRAEFERRRDYIVSRLNSMPGMICVKPDGAFYAFCDISKLGLGSVALANRLLDEAKIAVIPGEPFGADTCIRFSFAAGMETIKKGMDRLEEWIKKNG